MMSYNISPHPAPRAAVKLTASVVTVGDYSGFIPASSDFRTPVDPATQERYSDEQLYALALYLYSLKPPANPNRMDALARRGLKVFEAQG
jgi:hypothetical protein